MMLNRAQSLRESSSPIQKHWLIGIIGMLLLLSFLINPMILIKLPLMIGAFAAIYYAASFAMCIPMYFYLKIKGEKVPYLFKI